MRDLYKLIGVNSYADHEEIKRAISLLDSAEVSVDVLEVLLISSRKEHYDRLHSVLSDIGKLRGRLGIAHVSNSSNIDADDFQYKCIFAESMHDALMNKLKTGSVRNRSYNKKPKIKKVNKIDADSLKNTITMLAIIALVVLSVNFSHDSSDDDGLKSVPYEARDSGSNRPIASNRVSPASGADTIDIDALFSKTKEKNNRVNHSESFQTRPIVAMPTNGSITYGANSKRIAPLEIVTRGNKANYLIKLEDYSTNKHILDIFIRAGRTAKVDVPLGVFRIKYASGENWYGPEYMFGIDTNYSVAEDIFRFERKGNQVSGYSIELYDVIDGNLETRQISPGDF